MAAHRASALVVFHATNDITLYTVHKVVKNGSMPNEAQKRAREIALKLRELALADGASQVIVMIGVASGGAQGDDGHFTCFAGGGLATRGLLEVGSIVVRASSKDE